MFSKGGFFDQKYLSKTSNAKKFIRPTMFVMKLGLTEYFALDVIQDYKEIELDRSLCVNSETKSNLSILSRKKLYRTRRQMLFLPHLTQESQVTWGQPIRIKCRKKWFITKLQTKFFSERATRVLHCVTKLRKFNNLSV